MRRRNFCLGAAALPMVLTLAGMAVTDRRPRAETLGPGRSFSRQWLEDHARALAAQPFEAPVNRLPPALDRISWDDYQRIRFRNAESVWRQDDLAFQIRLFHLGLYFKHSVEINEVVGTTAYPVLYTSDLFNYGRVDLGGDLPQDLGFAGFRVHFHTNFDIDMVSFLGASYFRAVGGTRQYGVSARGLAIDTGLPRPEEFPEFRSFWIEKPAPGQTALVVHALLDSPSAAGAYTFTIMPGDTTLIDVDFVLFTRDTIERLGIAPCTSMFQHGENDRRIDDDFRPEVHDSDGLAMHTGTGEWIWRPIVNPPTLRFNTFLDENPQGFGLIQRDRDWDHYQDDGVWYDRRPNLWVEPRGRWGQGSVQLVEIPTPDETFDNIVAFWNPAEPIEQGQELRYAYRLFWGSDMPASMMTTATVTATRIGSGGIPGQANGRDARKFVIDFTGGALSLLDPMAPVEPVITASLGEVREPAARPIIGRPGWRVNFDLAADGPDVIDLRCFLRLNGAALSETWIYQWSPVPGA